MRRSAATRWAGLAAAVAGTAVAVPTAHAYPRPGTTERVSVASDGTQGNDDAYFGRLAITPDGRYVAFASAANNLVAGDTDGDVDVFVHDRLTGKTTAASVDSSGNFGVKDPVCGVGPWSPSAGAYDPAISANGRYVVFAGCYLGLVPGVPPASALLYHRTRVYLHDMWRGTTTLVSLNTKGEQANGQSDSPTISADGRYVAFESMATNLGAPPCGNDTETELLCDSTVAGILGLNGNAVYVRDLRTRKTTYISVAPDGSRADGPSYAAVISPDGRYVAFTSTADNLVSNDQNYACAANSGTRPTCPDVYLRDLVKQRTRLVSVGLDGNASNGNSSTQNVPAAISADDRFVAFTSAASRSNIVPNETAGGVYIRDLRTGRTSKANVDSLGTPLILGGPVYALSANGRYAVMQNVTLPSQPGCTGYGGSAIALHDTLTGAWEVIAPGADTGDCPSSYLSNLPAVSADGRYVAFDSNGRHLVRGDSNDKIDVFVQDRGAALGAGGLVRSGALTVSRTRGFATSGVAADIDAVRDVSRTLTAQGANLIGATLVYRPQYNDLFLRLPVARMPLFALANPAVVYGLDLTVNGVRYQVRAAKTGPLTASFGLFRRVAGVWAQVATLRGGYGTTGQEVVAALPLSAIGAAHGGHITHASAFTGLGSFLTGTTTSIDTATIGATP